MNRQEVFVQGHRGYRGAYPENSYEAFYHAMKLGVDAIELDVVLSKDQKIIISHEPYMCNELCLKPNGDSISKEESKQLNLYKMTAQEITEYSFGTLDYAKFPDQKKVKSHKLELKKMTQLLEAKFPEDFSFPQLTVEVKSHPNTDGEFHPAPKEYAKILQKELQLIDERWPIAIQSFDLRILLELDKQGCELPLIALSESKEVDIDYVCEKLEFIPDGFSPYYEVINEDVVEDCQSLGVELSAWTVNDRAEMERLFQLGVRSFITDFPDLIIR